MADTSQKGADGDQPAASKDFAEKQTEDCLLNPPSSPQQAATDSEQSASTDKPVADSSSPYQASTAAEEPTHNTNQSLESVPSQNDIDSSVDNSSMDAAQLDDSNAVEKQSPHAQTVQEQSTDASLGAIAHTPEKSEVGLRLFWKLGVASRCSTEGRGDWGRMNMVH